MNLLESGQGGLGPDQRVSKPELGPQQAWGERIESSISFGSCAKQTFHDKTTDTQSTKPFFCGPSLPQRICVNSSVWYTVRLPRTPYTHTRPSKPHGFQNVPDAFTPLSCLHALFPLPEMPLVFYTCYSSSAVSLYYFPRRKEFSTHSFHGSALGVHLLPAPRRGTSMALIYLKIRPTWLWKHLETT